MTKLMVDTVVLPTICGEWMEIQNMDVAGSSTDHQIDAQLFHYLRISESPMTADEH
jgi:hypothetical protein